jgi:guanylate kinase
MKNLVVCGTSGAGKTFLEEYLESHMKCVPLPKYFDREIRPGERKDKNIPLSRYTWMNMKDEFFFTLTYDHHNYGWKRSDLQKGKVSTLAITLESLDRFLNENAGFIPLLLWVESSNLDLLRTRMERRGETKEKILQRLTLAETEIRDGEKYKQLVKMHYGLVVIVKDDLTIFEELIPNIRSMGFANDMQ